MAKSIRLRLANGDSILDAHAVALAKFTQFSWDWYDGVSTAPDTLDPVDFAITIAMNSRATADRMKAFMKARTAMEECLRRLPSTVSLNSETTQEVFDVVEELFEKACEPPGTKLAVASKVLHRKRPLLIPMLDSVIVKYYGRILETSKAPWFDRAWLKNGSWSDPTPYMRTMASELEENQGALQKLRESLRSVVPESISDVRLFEATLYGHLIGS